jgi:hypothetical protein
VEEDAQQQGAGMDGDAQQQGACVEEDVQHRAVIRDFTPTTMNSVLVSVCLIIVVHNIAYISNYI